MLQKMSERVQGWFTWVIVGLISLSFAVWGITNYFSGNRGEVTVATVNGTDISQRSLAQQVASLKADQRVKMDEAFLQSPLGESLLKQQALQQLIRAQVLAQAGAQLKLAVSDQQITRYIREIPGLQVGGEFSPSQLSQLLMQLGISGEEFLQMIREEQLINQLQGGIIGSSFVLPYDLTHAAQLFYQKRDIAYAIVETNRFKDDITLTDDAIETYYAEHQDEFTIPEQLQVDYVLLDRGDVKSRLPEVTDEAIEAYYQAHIDSFTQMPRWKVAQIQIIVPSNASDVALKAADQKVAALKQALASGKAFESLVSTYSDDALTKAKEGEMGWVQPGMLDPALETALASLKTAQVSAPIRTETGYTVLKLLEQKPASVTPLEKVRPQIKKTLIAQDAEKSFVQAAESLSKLAFEQADSLQGISDTLSLKVKTSKPFSREGLKKAPFNSPEVINAAFSHDVMMAGNNSDVITVSDDTLMVLRLNSRTDAKQKTLDEVKEDIVAVLTQEAATQAAATFADTVLAEMRSSNTIDLETLASTYTLNWNTEADVVRIKPAKMPTLLQTESFQLPRPIDGKPSVTRVQLPNEDYAILYIQSVTDPDPSTVFEGQEGQQIEAELSRRFGEMAFQSYVNALVNNAKINIKEKAFAASLE